MPTWFHQMFSILSAEWFLCLFRLAFQQRDPDKNEVIVLHESWGPSPKRYSYSPLYFCYLCLQLCQADGAGWDNPLAVWAKRHHADLINSHPEYGFFVFLDLETIQKKFRLKPLLKDTTSSLSETRTSYLWDTGHCVHREGADSHSNASEVQTP